MSGRSAPQRPKRPTISGLPQNQKRPRSVALKATPPFFWASRQELSEQGAIAKASQARRLRRQVCLPTFTKSKKGKKHGCRLHHPSGSLTEFGKGGYCPHLLYVKFKRVPVLHVYHPMDLRNLNTLSIGLHGLTPPYFSGSYSQCFADREGSQDLVLPVAEGRGTLREQELLSGQAAKHTAE